MYGIREYSRDDVRETTVYGLIDPRTGEIRYVGHTVNLKQRLSFHMSQPASIAMRGWIGELKAAKLKPTPVILEKTTAFYAFKVELKWINTLHEAGAPLLNHMSLWNQPDYRAITEWRWGDNKR